MYNNGQHIGNGNTFKENHSYINYYNYDLKERLPTPQYLYLFPEPSLYFHGREDKLSEFHQSVQVCTNQTHSFLRTIVIQGFGGMGKSETARAYVYRVRNDYDYIVWFDSQTQAKLNSSFKKLAKILGESFKSTADIQNIYKKLAITYNRGIFIFDDAEGLKSDDQKLGIEEYLHMDHLPKKPIFIVTSRNGSNAWDTFKTQIKRIPIDRLSYDDTCQCVKKYLRIDNKMLPASLEKSICSVAKTLGGYPLALSLVSTTMGKRTDGINFDSIEPRVNRYFKILEIIPIKTFYDESDYKEKLNRIFGATTKDLRENENGCTAIDLLAIMAYLDPDGITLELIYAIYSCKCNDGSVSLEIKDLNFSNAMKLLKDYSLLKLCEGEVTVHRLIQKSAQNLATNKPLTSILRFFKKNEDNRRWFGHMKIVYNVLIDGTSV